MPVYTDAPPIVQSSKPGDYILRCVEFQKGLSKGAKTGGSDKYEAEFLVEATGSKLIEFFIDHSSCVWKLELWLKACGITLKKGEGFDFDQESATANGTRYIDPIGLRAHATIGMRPSKEAGQSPKWNEVVAWITNKEKLSRHIEAPEPTEPDPKWD